MKSPHFHTLRLKSVLRASFFCALGMMPIASSSLLSGCSGENLPAYEDQAEDLSNPIPEHESASDRLKREILEISFENMHREDNFEEVSALLFPKVAELQALAPTQSSEEQLHLLEGSWHQVWSNLEDMGPGFIKMDRSKVFQVVSADGYYYNFGQSRIFGLLNNTGVLRGRYTDTGDGFDIEFTRVGLLWKRIRSSTDLESWMNEIESGERKLRSFGAGQAPRGPVGIQGRLTTLYVDDTLRIAGGSQSDYRNESNEVLVQGRDNLLFVLTRDEPNSDRR